jgi:CubicO group peptidase (beta-lactamase class C family)
MSTLASGSSLPGVTPHARRRVRARNISAVLLVVSTAVTSCANPYDDCELGLTTDLQVCVSAYLGKNDEFGKVRAVMVYEDGESVLEHYRGDDAKDYLNTRSVTKSVIGTLIGIAIDEGAISGVDATLGELLPAYRDVMNAEVAAIPLQSILTHTAGFAAGGTTSDVGELDFYSAPDWVGAIIADRVARGPGTARFDFNYSNAGAHLLAAILGEATDGTVLDYARAKLFDPLGIVTEPAWVKVDEGTPEQLKALAEEYFAAGFAWPTDPQGINEGAGLLKLRPEDFAKLGLLYLNDGVWEGESIVSSAWVQEATTRQANTFVTPNGYGYLWWTDSTGKDPMYLALGYAGNVIAVVPNRDLVAVVATDYKGIDPLEEGQKFDGQEALTLVRNVILAHRE